MKRQTLKEYGAPPKRYVRSISPDLTQERRTCTTSFLLSEHAIIVAANHRPMLSVWLPALMCETRREIRTYFLV